MGGSFGRRRLRTDGNFDVYYALPGAGDSLEGAGAKPRSPLAWQVVAVWLELTTSLGVIHPD